MKSNTLFFVLITLSGLIGLTLIRSLPGAVKLFVAVGLVMSTVLIAVSDRYQNRER